MERMEAFADFLSQNAESISRDIVNYSLANLEIQLPQDIIESSVAINRDFLKLLGSTIKVTDEEVEEIFIQWFQKSQAESQAQIESHSALFEDISSIIKPYADNRRRLVHMISEVSMEQGLSTKETLFVNDRINYLLDLSMSHTFMERERLAKETNRRQQKIILDLSSPVVPIQNGIAILPLIGEVDFDKSEHIMNYVIPKVSQLKIECLIIDFSGLVTIDTETASRIFSIYRVLSLLGIEAAFTGLRPDLAATIVQAGIDFSSLRTFATVQQAILDFRH